MTPNHSAIDASKLLRKLPSVHELLQDGLLEETAQQYGRVPTREAARQVLEKLRDQVQRGENPLSAGAVDALPAAIVAQLEIQQQSRLRKVINATGILLHTGLGRAPLADQAIEAILQAAGYCNVEIDLLTGGRTQRSSSVEADLCALTGAEAAHVVNNNAGATGLVLAALATGKEVIVSQGELIEIGGGFRLPEVIHSFGAKLRAVGTTNRTRIADYESAIGEQTGALMQVHSSNYRIVGFTEQPSLRELVALGSERNVPIVHDIGSGALGDMASGLSFLDPLARDSIRAGADLVLFSGDKLMGGPQCGIIVGKQAQVRRLVNHPISRALRIDKLTLAALQATLAIHRRAESDPRALEDLPLARMLRAPVEQIRARAETHVGKLSSAYPDWRFSVRESVAYAGGGTLPGQELPSAAIGIAHAAHQADVLARALRTGKPAIVGRVHEDMLLLDLRCVVPEKDDDFRQALDQLCFNHGSL